MQAIAEVSCSMNRAQPKGLPALSFRLPVFNTFGCNMEIRETGSGPVNRRPLLNKSGACAPLTRQACLAGSRPENGLTLLLAVTHRKACLPKTFFSQCICSRRAFMMVDKDLPAFGESSQPETLGALPFEAADYMEYVDDLELTEAQKVEFLRTLWTIMSAFVELGFGVDSVMPMLAQKASETSTDALQTEIPTHEFNVAADDEPERFEP